MKTSIGNKCLIQVRPLNVQDAAQMHLPIVQILKISWPAVAPGKSSGTCLQTQGAKPKGFASLAAVSITPGCQPVLEILKADSRPSDQGGLLQEHLGGAEGHCIQEGGYPLVGFPHLGVALQQSS